MQNPPQLSPDGNYWWDGQAWQLMPGRVAAAPAAQPATDTPRPSWLPEEIAVPMRPAPPEPPFVPQPVVVGGLGGPAVYAPAWANEPPPPPEPISIPKKIVCWAGLVLGGGLLLLGMLGVIYVVGSIINAAVAVTNPVGGGRYVIPWTMLAVVAFRAWRGRWVGAILILISWAISTTITLTLARG